MDAIPLPPPPPRILTRRYTLTKTGYKFLDIGVVVGSPSHVSIVLGDCHGKEISFSPDSWRKLVEQKQTILKSLRSDDVETQTPLTIENVGLRFGKINNLPILRLDTSSTRLVISLATAIVMFDHDYCVDRIVRSLISVTTNVDAKFSRFLEIASVAAHSTDVPKAIRESQHFDRDDIIDCELAVVCFGY